MYSQNGWGCITTANSKLLRPYKIGPVELVLRTGPAGFILAHNALWFHEEIERLWPDAMPDHDDHGWGQRYIGSTRTPSNHWSATATDLNARLHPQGPEPEVSFTAGQCRRIRKRVAENYGGTLLWGGDFRSTSDAMHWELTDRASYSTPAKVRAVALDLVDTAVGRRLIKAQSVPVQWRSW